MINEYFDKYGDWVVSLTYNEGYSVLAIRVKSDWEIKEEIPHMEDYLSLGIEYDYSTSKKEDGMVNMVFYAEGVVLDELTSVIHKEVVQHNIEIETRKELYLEKKSELLELFNTLTIDELRRLELIKNNNTGDTVDPLEQTDLGEITETNTEDVTTEQKL